MEWRRATQLVLSMIVLAAAVRARAEEPPPPPLPPPRWIPVYLAPPPTPAEIDALERRGHERKRTGAILLGAGIGIAAIGTGLMIGGAWEDNGCHHSHDSFDHHHQGFDCGVSALSIAGFTTTFIGAAAIIPGAFIFSDGARDVARARMLRGR
jgi:hypothetical protein